MQTVSAAFKAAILAPERRIRTKIELVLFDNDSLYSGSATYMATSTHTPVAGYRAEVLKDNPVGYWRLGESTGAATAVDDSGNELDGTYHSGAANLLTLNQSSVETDTTGFNSNNGATLARSTAQYLDGAASLQVTHANLSGSGPFLSAVMGPAVGASYTFSVYAYNPGTAVSISVGINFNNSTTNISGGSNTVTIPTGVWTRVSYTGVAPSGADRMFPYLYSNGAEGTFVLYYDQLQLEGNDAATTWVQGGSVNPPRMGQQGALYPADQSTATTFDGSSNWLFVPYNAAFAPTTAVTVEMWVNLTALPTGNEQYILASKGSAGGIDTYLLRCDAGSGSPYFGFWVESPAGSWEPRASSAGVITLQAATWYHVVGVYDGAYVYLYVNGTLMQQVARTGALDNSTSGNLTIGYNTPATLQGVALYGTAVTATRIAAHYAARMNPVGPYGVPYSLNYAFDGSSTLGYTAAVAAPDVYASNTLFPIQSDGSAGWWGDEVSDASGNLAVPQVITVTYQTAQTVAAVTVAADKSLNYPVNFVIDYWTGSSWTTITTQTGWAPDPAASGNSAVFVYNLFPTTISTTALRLTITKISKANRYPSILEFSNGWTLDTNGVLKDRVKSIEIDRQAYYEDETSLPIGNYAAGTATVVLDNSDGLFSQRNTASPYVQYFKPNRKVRIFFGLYTNATSNGDVQNDANYEYLLLGTFYTMGFRGGLSKNDVEIDCWDQVKKLQETQYTGSQVLEQQTISGLFVYLCQALGYQATQYKFDTTHDILDYAYFDSAPYWDHFKNLAEAEAGYVYFDESNVLTLRDRYMFSSTRLTGAVGSGVNILPVGYCEGVQIGDTIYVMDTLGNQDAYTVTGITYNDSTDTSGSFTVSPNTVRPYAVNCYVSKQTPVIAIDEKNAITDLTDEYTLERMRNHIIINNNPLTVALDSNTGQVITSSVVIFHRDTTTGTQEPFTVPAGGNQILNIVFEKPPILIDGTHTIGISGLVYDVTGTGGTKQDPSYITYQWVDGQGNPIAGPTAVGGYLKVMNSDSQARSFVLLSISGWPMERHGGVANEAKKDNLINQYGDKTFTMSTPFVIRSVHGQAIASHLLRMWQDPTTPMSISLPARGLFHVQLGDRIKVNNGLENLTDANQNNQFLVVHHHLKYDGALDSTIDVIAAN